MLELFSQLMMTGLMIGGVYGLIALGIILIIKSCGVFNFSHASVVVLGAFMFWSFLVQLRIPLWACIILITAWAILLGLLIERLVLRPLTGQPLLAALMATLALSEVISGFVTIFWPGSGRMYSPPFLPKGAFFLGIVTIPYNQLICLVACLVAFGLFGLFFRYAKQGLNMRAASEDHQLARSLGVNTKRIFQLSWVIAVLTASLSGIIVGSFMGISQGLEGIGVSAFPAVIFGGLESIIGGVIGGLCVGILQNLGGGYIDQYVGGGIKEIAPYVIMLLILVLRPHGLFGYKKIERV